MNFKKHLDWVLEWHTEQGVIFEKQAGKIRSKYSIKVNKFIFKALCALQAFLFLTQKSLTETITHVKTTLFNTATNNKSKFILCPNKIHCDLGHNKAAERNRTKVSKCEQSQSSLFISYQRKFCACATSCMSDLLSSALMADRNLSQLS